MRKLGLIGGMSWASTVLYYEQINRTVGRRLGGRHSAPLTIESLDFDPMATAMAEGDWAYLADMLGDAGRRLADAGCEGIAICSNTMHKLYDRLSDIVPVPILHIGDVTADAMRKAGIGKAVLLGTRFTMNEPFMRDRLRGHGIELIVPDPERMAEIDRIIFEELVKGEARVESKRTMKTFLTNMDKTGIEAAVLGCTELSMIVNTQSNVVPIFDTTTIHAEAAADWILSG